MKIEIDLVKIQVNAIVVLCSSAYICAIYI